MWGQNSSSFRLWPPGITGLSHDFPQSTMRSLSRQAALPVQGAVKAAPRTPAPTTSTEYQRSAPPLASGSGPSGAHGPPGTFCQGWKTRRVALSRTEPEGSRPLSASRWAGVTGRESGESRPTSNTGGDGFSR